MVAAARLQVEVDANTSRAQQQLSSFMGNISRTGLAMVGLGAGIAAGAGVAALAIGKIGLAYDDALNTFQAVSGATAEQMESVRKTAKALGNDTTLVTASAGDAATAMAELARGGLSVDESIKGARGTLALAAAAGIEVGEAANIAARALNTFGLDGSQAARVADVLAAGANKSAADLPAMAAALQQAGASANAAGLSIEDTTAAIALLANNGIAGSDAGTSLKTMLSSLVAPAGTGAAMMKQLGLSMYDANGNMVPFREMLSRTAGAIGGLATEQEKAAAIQAIFGSDASRAANILLKEGVPGFDAMRAGVEASGQAMDVAAAKNKGLGGQLRILQSTLETLAISIYDSVKGPLASFVGTLTSGLTGGIAAAQSFATQARAALDQFMASPFFQNTILPIIQAVQGAFATIGEFISGTLVPALDRLLAPLGGISSILPVIAAMFGGALLAAIGGLAAAAGGLLLGALTAVGGVLLGIPAIIAGLVAAFIFAWKNSETFRNIVMAVFDAVRRAVSAVVDWFRGTALPMIQTFFRGVMDKAQELLGFFQRIWPAVKETVATAWNIIKPIVTGALAILKNAFDVWWAAVSAGFDVFWTLISGLFRTAWGLIKGIVEAALNIIKGVIKTVLGLITGDWKLAWEGIKNILSGVWGLIKTVVQAGFDFIKTLISTGLAVLKGIWNVGWTTIKSVLDSVWEAIKAAVKAAWEMLKAAVTNGIQGVVGMVKGLPGKIVSALGNLGGLLRSAGADLIRGFLNGIGDMASAAADKAREVANAAKNAVKNALGIGSPSRVFHQFGKWTGEGLVNGLNAMVGKVGGAGERLADAAMPTGAGVGLGGAVPGAGAYGMGRAGGGVTVAPGAIVIDARGATPETVPMLRQAGDDMLVALLRELQAG